MNRTQLEAAAALGCRIQIWHLRPGATSSAHGQWDDADPTVKPTFECPEHLYRVHPDDLHLLRAGYEQRARGAIEVLAGMRIFVISRQRIKKPEGDDLFDKSIAELRAIVAALEEAPAGTVGEPIQVEAVAEYSPERGMSWLIEGEGSDLPDGTILCTIDKQHLLADGGTVLYTRPAPAVVDEAMVDRLSQDAITDLVSAANYARHNLQRVLELEWQECTCEECPECGKQPIECSGTNCASTCQCSLCDHCCATDALEDLTATLAQPQGRGAVDLEQFREAVAYWRDGHRFGHNSLQHGVRAKVISEANHLIAIIDAQSAKGGGNA